jgi:hypothetical protein
VEIKEILAMHRPKLLYSDNGFMYADDALPEEGIVDSRLMELVFLAKRRMA